MIQTISPSVRAQTPVGAANATALRVLIIDREEYSQVMTAALEAEGFNVIHDSDPATSMNKACGPDLSLILVGEQVVVSSDQCAALSRTATPETPIVLLHSVGQDVRAQVKKIGAEVYFSRATPVESIISYVRARLNWRCRLEVAA